MRRIVGPEQEGLRLDQFLAAVAPVSRRRARELVAAGKVRRNGAQVRVQRRPVRRGDVVELAEDALPGEAAPPQPPPAILFRDAWLVAVDKPAGVLSQPAERRAPGELAMDERLMLALAGDEPGKPFLRLVHRLDRVTSGVLLFAARPEALPPLRRAWREGRVERLYLAVVEGEPEWERRRVDAPIARAAGGGWRFAVDPAGQPAATEVAVLERGGGRCLVGCRLLTGRTHQVRVHLAHLGHPVLGDRLYGARDPAPLPLLHAAELRLPHPEDGRAMTLAAPVPEDVRTGLRGEP